MGILQGLTEFLPVSSSGHLTLYQYFSTEVNENLSLNIAVHLGTLLTILIYYRKDIMDLLMGLLRRDYESIQMCIHIIVASIPTALIGLFMKKNFEWILTDPVIAGLGLMGTGFILLSSAKGFDRRAGFNLSGFGTDIKTAFIIGIVQGFAVLPGISRSGSTIVSGLFLGMDSRNAARFSFLISVPAIFGAGLLEFVGSEQSLSIKELGIGVLVSFVTGLLAISWMVRLVQNNRLKGFAYYVFGLSGLFFAYLLMN